MKCGNNHRWFYFTEEIRCCSKCGFIETRSPQHFSQGQVAEIRKAAGFDDNAIRQIQKNEPNPVSNSVWSVSSLLGYIAIVLVFVFLTDRFTGISFIVDRMLLAPLLGIFIFPYYKIQKLINKPLHSYFREILQTKKYNSLSMPLLMLIFALFLIGLYCGYSHGLPGIYKFGSTLLGGFLFGVIGVNLVGLLLPRAYICFWFSYFLSKKEVVSEWVIIMLPVTSILSIFITIGLSRVDRTIGFTMTFWPQLIDGALIIAFLAQISVLFAIFRIAKEA